MDKILEKLAGLPIPYTNWDKAKQIPLSSSEYRVIGEKILKDKVNTSKIKSTQKNIKNFINAAKKAKRKYDNLPPDKKKLFNRELAIRGAVRGGKAALVGGSVYTGKELLVPNSLKRTKKDDKSRDKDVQTKAMRDVVKPTMKKEVVKLPAHVIASAGAALGGGTGVVANQLVAMRKNMAGIKVDAKDFNKKKILAGGAGAIIGATPGLLASHIIDNQYRVKEYDRLKRRYMGEKITKDEKKKIKKPMIRKYKNNAYTMKTPASLIQAERRKQQKQAYQILEEGLEKNALFNISKNFTPATSTLKGGLPGGSLLSGSLSKYNSQTTAPTKNYAQILKPVEKVKSINPTKGVIGK